MSRKCLSVLILYFSLHHAHQHMFADVETSEPANNFDIFIFSQKWLVTICKDWIHHSYGSECVYPSKKKQFSVQGIWPANVERKDHPQYCNNSWAFDPEQIKTIEDELEQVWATIFKGIDPHNLWEHEWKKHGTCATALQPFNTQFKYFSKGIEWYKKYSLMDMFEAANIFPDDTKQFTAEEFATAVKEKSKKSALVTCYSIDGVQYLWAMHTCFDKQLNLIDCDPVAEIQCDLSKGIIFPANA